MPAAYSELIAFSHCVFIEKSFENESLPSTYHFESLRKTFKKTKA